MPTAAAIGREGAAYGRANAQHFDARRGTLLGVRWYHFFWLPLLIHCMLLTAVFGSVYGFQWLTTVWKSGVSPLVIVPAMFLMVIFATLQWLGSGALKTYFALAGFDDSSGSSTFRRVMKYGFGYTLATVLALGAISVAHYGLRMMLAKIFG